MAAKSSLRNMALCLTGVCLVCSAVLAGTFALTKDPIAEASRKALEEALSMVLLADGEIDSAPQFVETADGSFEYYVQSRDGAPVCFAVKSTVTGFGGPLTVLVGVDTSGIIRATKVLSHSETPGLGAKCENDVAFLSQFEGFDPAAGLLMVSKDKDENGKSGSIDAITASTITSRAYTGAVAAAAGAAAKIMEDRQ